MTLRFGVIGSPIRHSRSPALHEAAYRALGIEATYERILVEPADLAAFLSSLVPEGFRGVNVTIPHKKAVIAHLDEVSPTARSIGAVNTITVEDARLIGDNTDAPGLIRALADSGFDARGAEVVIIGAGGAARAAIVGLGDAGATKITVAARRRDAAAALIHDLDSTITADLEASALDASLAEVFSDAALLVQATSATLAGNPDAQSFADTLPLSALPGGAMVIDLVYTPRTTTVLAAAASRGLTVVDGLGMLVHQGALAFELWTGRPAPIDEMHRALA